MTEEMILPPQAREAEQALLGSVLINPAAYREVAKFLQPEDFYVKRHGTIWEIIVRLMEQNLPVDYVTLVHKLDQAGKLEEAGGPAYLVGLLNSVPNSMHAEAYGHLIQQAAVRRRMIEAANQTARLAYCDKPLEEVIDEAEKALMQASERVASHNTLPSLKF